MRSDNSQPASTDSVAPNARIRAYLALWLIALVVRGLFLVVFHFYPNVVPVEQQRDLEAERFATTIAAGEGMTIPYFPNDNMPSALRCPIHPLVLATIRKLTAPDERSFLLGTYVLFSCISAGTVVLYIRVAAEVFNGRAALVFGLGLALYPPSIYYATNATSDNTLVFAVLAGLSLLAIRFRSRGGSREATVFGGFLGLGALVNASVLAVGLPYLAWIILRSEASLAARARLVAVVSVTLVVVVSPWLVRNALAFDEPVFLRSNFGMELRAGNHGDGVAYQGPDQFYINDPTERELLRELGEPAYSRNCRDRALAWITEDPIRFASLTVRRAGVFWGKEVFYGEFTHITLPTVGVPMVLGLVGIFLALRDSNNTWVLAIPLIFFPLVYYITHAEARYRFPIDAYFLMGFAYLITRVHAWVAACVAGRNSAISE